MRSGKIFVFAIAALFCIGSLAVLAGPNASAADPPELNEAGDAYGQSFKLDMKALEPYLKEEFGFDKNADFLECVNEVIALAVGSGLDLDEGVIFDKIEISKLDFKLIIASLSELLKADENGAVISFAAGIGVEATLAGKISGMLPKNGSNLNDTFDVEARSVDISLSVAASVMVSGTMELDADGNIKSIFISVDLFASATIEAGFTLQFVYDEDDDLEQVIITYGKFKFGVSAEANAYAKLGFELYDEDDDTIYDGYDVTIEELGASGKISISSDLKKLIDSILNQEGFVDSILNLTFDGDKLLDDGKFNLNDFLSELKDEINGEGTQMDLEESDFLKELVSTGLIGNYLPELAGLLEDLLGDSDIGTKMNDDSLFAGLQPGQLDGPGVEEVKRALQEIKDIGNDDGDAWTLVLVAIAFVAVLGIFSVAFFARKP